MIVFDLKCDGDHVFEAWFSSSSSYEDQKTRGLLMCAVCGSSNISKAVMAPNVSAKGNQRVHGVPAAPSQVSGSEAPAMMTPSSPGSEVMMAAMQKLAALQAEAIKTSQWVGQDFERQARAMDAGEIGPSQIHGQATPEQARAMVEDGIGVMPLLIPVVPPDKRN